MFFQKKMKKQTGGITDVNMTPLIDVSLVLVVILLLTTPLAFESSIAVRKAAKAAAAAKQRENDERVELKVVSEDMVKVNRILVPRKNLTTALKPLMDSSPSRLVVIACSDNVSHGAFVDVLDQAKLSGASEIAVTEK